MASLTQCSLVEEISIALLSTYVSVSAVDIDDCLPNPCGTHGSCVDGVDNYTCTCHAGYTGVNCQTGE